MKTRTRTAASTMTMQKDPAKKEMEHLLGRLISGERKQKQFPGVGHSMKPPPPKQKPAPPRTQHARAPTRTHHKPKPAKAPPPKQKHRAPVNLPKLTAEEGSRYRKAEEQRMLDAKARVAAYTAPKITGDSVRKHEEMMRKNQQEYAQRAEERAKAQQESRQDMLALNRANVLDTMSHDEVHELLHMESAYKKRQKMEPRTSDPVARVTNRPNPSSSKSYRPARMPPILDTLASSAPIQMGTPNWQQIQREQEENAARKLANQEYKRKQRELYHPIIPLKPIVPTPVHRPKLDPRYAAIEREQQKQWGDRKKRERDARQRKKDEDRQRRADEKAHGQKVEKIQRVREANQSRKAVDEEIRDGDLRRQATNMWAEYFFTINPKSGRKEYGTPSAKTIDEGVQLLRNGNQKGFRRLLKTQRQKTAKKNVPTKQVKPHRVYDTGSQALPDRRDQERPDAPEAVVTKQRKPKPGEIFAEVQKLRAERKKKGSELEQTFQKSKIEQQIAAGKKQLEETKLKKQTVREERQNFEAMKRTEAIKRRNAQNIISGLNDLSLATKEQLRIEATLSKVNQSAQEFTAPVQQMSAMRINEPKMRPSSVKPMHAPKVRKPTPVPPPKKKVKPPTMKRPTTKPMPEPKQAPTPADLLVPQPTEVFPYHPSKTVPLQVHVAGDIDPPDPGPGFGGGSGHKRGRGRGGRGRRGRVRGGRGSTYPTQDPSIDPDPTLPPYGRVNFPRGGRGLRGRVNFPRGGRGLRGRGRGTVNFPRGGRGTRGRGTGGVNYPGYTPPEFGSDTFPPGGNIPPRGKVNFPRGGRGKRGRGGPNFPGYVPPHYTGLRLRGGVEYSDGEVQAIQRMPEYFPANRIRGSHPREISWNAPQLMKPRLEVEQVDNNTLIFRVRGGIDKSIRQQVILALRRRGRVVVNGQAMTKTQAVPAIMQLLKEQSSATVSF